MITWIQVILQKHHKVVFSILLFVIIIAFVFTIGSSIPFFGDRSAQKISRKEVFGYNLDDPAVKNYIARQAAYQLRLSGEELNEQSMNAAFLRYAYLSWKAEQLGIRTLGADDIKGYVSSLAAFKNADGSFNAKEWDNFIKNSGMGEDELLQIITKNAIASKVERLLAGPGYVLDPEVKLVYNDIFGKWDVEIAHFSFDGFKPEIAVDDDKLKSYYNINKEVFRVPASVALDIAFIPAPAASDKKFSDEEIDAHYKKTITNYIEVKNGEYKIKPIQDVKADVVKDLRAADAANAAFIAADEIVTKIYDDEVKFNSPEFKKIIADAKLEIKSLPHVLPTDSKLPDGIPADVFKAGFELDAKKFYTDPVLAENGAYLVFFRESNASYIPDFVEIKSAVEKRYKDEEKARLFAEAGAKAADAVKAALKDGKKFEDAAKAEGLTVSAINSFSFADKAFRTPSMYVYLELLNSQLPKMKPGDVSPMLTRSSGGYMVYAASFKAPETKADAEEYKMLENQAKMQAMQNSAITIMRGEMDKVLGQ